MPLNAFKLRDLDLTGIYYTADFYTIFIDVTCASVVVKQREILVRFDWLKFYASY